jgi:hypothetical protein
VHAARVHLSCSVAIIPLEGELSCLSLTTLPDRISDSVNQWLANHPYADVVSIQFGQFERAFGAIVLYRLRPEGEHVRGS